MVWKVINWPIAHNYKKINNSIEGNVFYSFLCKEIDNAFAVLEANKSRFGVGFYWQNAYQVAYSVIFTSLKLNLQLCLANR